MKEITSAKDKKSHSGSNVSQHEAAALKVMMQFFADEILPFLGISGKVVSIAPTESIYLELKNNMKTLISSRKTAHGSTSNSKAPMEESKI